MAIKVVLFLDNPINQTGYASTCRLTGAELLARGYEVYAMAFNAGPQPGKDEIGDWYGMKIIPNYAAERDSNNLYGDLETVLKVQSTVNPDIYFFHNDSYRYSYIPKLPKNILERSVFWLPFEGANPDYGGIPIFDSVAAVRFVSEHAMTLHVNHLHNKDVGVIPHAVNLKDFTPCVDKYAAKLTKNLGIENKFVVTRIDRHQPRKYWDLSIKAFAKFAKDKDDVFFLAKCNPRDFVMSDSKRGDVDLEVLAGNLGISKKIFFDDFFFNTQALVGGFYHPADVFLTTTSGEGFGLGLAEAMACEVPIICPEVPVLPEVVGKGGMFCSIEGQEYSKMNVIHNLVNVDDVVDNLEKSYKSWKMGSKELRAIGKAGREQVISKYDAKKVYDEWDRVLQSVRAKRDLVSIVTVLYNIAGVEQISGEDGIERFKKSLDEHVKHPYEWIIVENGSPARAETRAWLFAAAESDRRIRPIMLEQNVGFAGGCNVGIDAAKGKYVVLANPDCEALEPSELGLPGDFLSMLVTKVRSNPNVGIVGMELNRRDDILKGSIFPYFCNVMITRECLDACKIGPRTWLDEAFWPAYYEDLDFTIRAIGKGFEVVSENVPFWHKSGGTNKFAIKDGKDGVASKHLLSALDALNRDGIDKIRKRSEILSFGMQGLIEGNIRYINSKYGPDRRANIKIVWNTHIGAAVGFSQLAEGLIPELDALGFDVYVNDWNNGNTVSNPIIKKLIEKTRVAKEEGVDLENAINIVCWLMEAFLDVDADYKVGISLCESTKVRPQYLNACNSMDRILTFSRFCQGVQKDSGYTSKINIIPPGVGEEFLTYHQRIPKDKFTFLAVGVSQERKDTSRLVQAFCEAFPKHAENPPECEASFPIKCKDIELVLKSNVFGELSWVHEQGFTERANIRTIFTGSHPKADRPDLTTNEMYDLYCDADCLVHPSHGEGIGVPLCFSKGTSVLTLGGVINIEDLTIGDKVYTHSGKTSSVKNVMSRLYDGPVVRIKCLMNNTWTECTPEHPILSVKKKYKRSNDKRHAFEAPEWIEAGSLKKGDMVVVPIGKIKNEDRTIDLANFLEMESLEHDDTSVWSKYSNKPNGITANVISNASGVSKRQVHRVMQGLWYTPQTADYVAIKTKDNVIATMDRLGFESDSYVKCNRYLNIDYTSGLLFGYYMAEGSIRNGNISFAFNSNETEYHSEVKNLMMSVFGLKNNYSRHREGKSYELIFSSICVAKIFEKICGKGAKTKKLNDIENLNSDFKRGFLKGFWNGDGSYSKSKSCLISFATSSKNLSSQLWKMLIDFGKHATLKTSFRKKHEREFIEYIIEYSCNSNDDITGVEFASERSRLFYHKTIKTNEYFLAPIKEIQQLSKVNIPVFNIEVEGDNSYCVNGFAVHNCEAAGTGLPIIFTNWSSPSEYFNETNSYPCSLSPYEGTTFTEAYPGSGTPGENGKWANCFVAGSPVRTLEGVTSIEQIEQGDEVLTHKGRYRKVINVSKRDYSGTAIRLRGGYNNVEITTTCEHPILVSRNGESSFVTANSINKGDLIPFPFIKDDVVLEDIDLNNYTNCRTRHNEKYVWTTGLGFNERLDKKRSIKKIAEFSSVSKSVAQRAIANSKFISRKTKIKVLRVANCLKFKKSSNYKINRFIKIDKSFARLCGFYLAEGCAEGSRIVFSFHKKEKAYVSDILNLMFEKFRLKGTVSKNGDNGVCVSFFNAVIVRMFNDLFGTGSKNKAMPSSWSRMNKELAGEVVYGLWHGDGCRELMNFSYKSSSIRLAYQMSSFLAKLDIASSMNKNNIDQYVVKVYGKKYTDMMAKLLDEKEFERKQENPKEFLFDEKYVYLPVRSIESVIIREPVYNLEVEEDNTYCVGNITVHNCHIGHMKFLMYHIIRNRDEATEKGKRASALMNEKHSWSESARILMPLIFEWEEERKKKTAREVFSPITFKRPQLKPIENGDRVLIDIVSRDRHSYLCSLLTSLLMQTFKNWDVIIQCDDVDDSMPADFQIISLMDRYSREGHSWRIIRSHRQGPHMAHDRTLQMAKDDPHYKYKLICRIDDDIIVRPDYLEKIYSLFLNDPKCEIGAVSGIYPDPKRSEDDQLAPLGFEADMNYAGKIDYNVPWPYICTYPKGTKPREVEHLYSSFMYRLEIATAIGGYCRLYSQIGHREESDFSYRFFLGGWKLLIHPEAVGFHFAAPSGGIRSNSIINRDMLARSDNKIYLRRLRKWKTEIQSALPAPVPVPVPVEAIVVKDAPKKLLIVINGGNDLKITQEAVNRSLKISDNVYVTCQNQEAKKSIKGAKAIATTSEEIAILTKSIVSEGDHDLIMTITDSMVFSKDPLTVISDRYDNYVFEVYKTYMPFRVTKSTSGTIVHEQDSTKGRVVGTELSNSCLISRKNVGIVDISKTLYCDIQVFDDVLLIPKDGKSIMGNDLILASDMESTHWKKICTYQFPEGKLNPPKTAEHYPPSGAVVSIIVPTAGRRFLLKKCIDSIYTFTTTPFEIIVVDNGSKDGTKEYLEAELKTRPGIKHLRQETNLGYQKAVNIGIAASSGKFVLLFNDDAWIEAGEPDGRDWLKTYIDELSDKKVGIVGPHGGKSPALQNEMLFFWCVMLRKDVLDEIGPLDDITFKNYGGDDDYCYDDKTQIVTKGGVKFIKDVTVDDEILTMREDEIMEYQKPERVIKKKEKHMYCFKSRRLDLVVTPEQKLLVGYEYKEKDIYHPLKFIRADDLNKILWKKQCRRFVKKNGGKWVGDDSSIKIINGFEMKAEHFAEFMGWYLSEGHCQRGEGRGYSIVISQQKELNRKSIESLLNAMNLSYRISSTGFYIHSHKPLHDYLCPLGLSKEKRAPDDILQMSSRLLNIFLKAFERGDGTRKKKNGFSLYTSSIQLRDNLVEVLLKTEKSFSFCYIQPRYIKFDNGTYNCCGMWHIQSSQERKAKAFIPPAVEIHDYDGFVYDVTVKNQRIYVIRNGKGCWSSNCERLRAKGYEIKTRYTHMRHLMNQVADEIKKPELIESERRLKSKYGIKT